MGKDLLLVVFGWLLGLSAPIITTLILNKRKSKTINAGIRNELKELQHRTVLSAYILHKDHGKFDHELLQWAKRHIDSYDGINKKESFKKIVDMELGLTEEALHQYVKSLRDETKGKSLQYFRTPYLDSQLTEIGKFSTDEQTILLEIVEHIKINNETVDEAKAYFSMTFDTTITDNNHRIVNSSLDKKYLHLAERSQIIFKKIDAFNNL